jgi:AraC-like DNA-binding protein
MLRNHRDVLKSVEQRVLQGRDRRDGRVDYHTLLVPFGGNLELDSADSKILLVRGEALYVPPATAFWAEHGDQDGAQYFAIGFRTTQEMPHTLLRKADRSGRLLQFATWLFFEHTNAEAHDFASALLTTLLAEFARLPAVDGNGLVPLTRAFIWSHLGDPLTISDLARAAGLNRQRFCRVYYEEAGLHPMEDVRRMRLDAARHLLSTTSLPLWAVAPRVGFADQRQLARLLRRHFGLRIGESREMTPDG